MWRARAGTQVAVQRLAGPAAKRKGPLAATFAEDQDDVQLQVDVVEPAAGQLVAAGLEGVASADLEQPTTWAASS